MAGDPAAQAAGDQERDAAHDDVVGRDAMEERKLGTGTGGTADDQRPAPEDRQEAGRGAHGNASDSGDPTGTGRPMLSDEDNTGQA